MPTAKAKSAEKETHAEVKSSPFNSPSDIKLGMTVRDPVSGITGVATIRTMLLSGTTQIAIQPKGEGTIVPDAIFIDDFLLEFVDDGISARVTPVDTSVTVKLGEHVQDILTGFDGIATQRTEFLNGCVYFDLTPRGEQPKKMELKARLTSDGKLPTAYLFDHKRLKVIGDGLTETKRPQTEEPIVQKKRGTGGPSISAKSVLGRMG